MSCFSTVESPKSLVSPLETLQYPSRRRSPKMFPEIDPEIDPGG